MASDSKLDESEMVSGVQIPHLPKGFQYRVFSEDVFKNTNSNLYFAEITAGSLIGKAADF